MVCWAVISFLFGFEFVYPHCFLDCFVAVGCTSGLIVRFSLHSSRQGPTLACISVGFFWCGLRGGFCPVYARNRLRHGGACVDLPALRVAPAGPWATARAWLVCPHPGVPKSDFDNFVPKTDFDKFRLRLLLWATARAWLDCPHIQKFPSRTLLTLFPSRTLITFASSCSSGPQPEPG